MNKFTLVLILVILLVGGYLLMNRDSGTVTTAPTAVEDQTYTTPPATSATYSNAAYGIEFTYPTLYELKEADGDNGALVHRITLMTKEEASTPPPEGGEGPATISFRIYKNENNEEPRVWTERNRAETNFNLIQGTTTEIVVDGANGIRYTADGLYANDTVVVAHNAHIYVLNAAYIDDTSPTLRDFPSILSSVNFVSQEEVD